MGPPGRSGGSSWFPDSSDFVILGPVNPGATPTTSTPSFADTYRIDPPTAGSVAAGIATAILLQVGAAFALAVSLAIVFMAAFANFGHDIHSPEPTWWVVFAIPFALAALITWVGSGLAASKMMRSDLGWLTLVGLPTLILLRFSIGL